MSENQQLGEFENLALLAVLRLGEGAYGARIQEELERTGERHASISAIYITLMRLQEKGLVSSHLGDPTEVRGGKARRFFRVKPEGVRALRATRERLLAMWDGVEAQLGESPSGGSA